MDACDGERPRCVGEPVDRRVGREDQPAVVRLEPVFVDEAADERIVGIAAPEAGRADDLILAVDGLCDPEPSFRGGSFPSRAFAR